MIHICNWLLTRRCNLRCSYCGIIKDKENKPKEYSPISSYYSVEMTTEYVKNILYKIKKHNPNCFHIFYGGEPFLRKDLPEIIEFCNIENIHYTIISNNTKQVQSSINWLISKVGKISGFTASVDPIIYENKISDDVKQKSLDGFERLVNMKKYCGDVVAEITVTNENKRNLYRLVKELTDRGIGSDITFVDIAKNQYYDFSNVYDKNLLVNPNKELKDIFEKMLKDNLDIHMSDSLLPRILNTLPSNLDCEIENGLHNITIDADGSLRLCLRIKGFSLYNLISAEYLFDYDNKIHNGIFDSISESKRKYCQLCNWTCMEMSKLISEGFNPNGLIHSDKRG